MLTETKDSAGCRLLADGLTEGGWQVRYPVPEPGGYGVMIATTVQAEPGHFGDQVGIPARQGGIRDPSGRLPGRWKSSGPMSPPATPAPRRPSASAPGSPAATPLMPPGSPAVRQSSSAT